MYIFNVYLYCISLLYIFIVYLYCISLLYIFIVYLYCIFLIKSYFIRTHLKTMAKWLPNYHESMLMKKTNFYLEFLNVSIKGYV